MRFLTDHLQWNFYFKTHREVYKPDRFRNLFANLKAIEGKLSGLEVMEEPHAGLETSHALTV